MKIQIRRVGVLQLAKIVCVLYSFIGLLMFVFGSIALVGGRPNPAELLLMTFIYPIFGFAGGLIAGTLYNIAANFVGGLTFEFDGVIQDDIPTDESV